MHLKEAERLLNELRSGRISAADLSGEQFQAIIFHKLIEQCGEGHEFEYELVDNYRGAVDFVVREKPGRVSQFHTEDPVHVFECKYYKRTLELSTVAKLLVVGVRFQPTSLNIVSGTSLQPQVYEYARLLFNGLGNDAAMFRRTFFRHYRAGDLLEMEIDCDDAIEDLVTALGKSGKERIADLSWELAELRPFSEKIVAASNKRNSAVTLDGRWSYRLRMSWFTAGRPDRLKCWLEGLPGEISYPPAKTEVTALDKGRHYIRFTQMIDPRRLERRVDGHLELHVTYASRSHHVFTIPVSAIPPPKDTGLHQDLRQKEVDKFASLLQQREAPRLLLLGGEAGVGKTHLCESIAERLQLTGEFDVNRFSADPGSETTLLHTMLTTVCTPAAARTGSTDEWQELAASLLNALSPVPEAGGPHQPRAEPMEVLIPVLAELLVRAGPRLLVLRDAHLLTESAAGEFGTLVGRLDDLGWGDVYCIVEHRTSERENNPHWTDLESRLRARVNGCLQRHLEPLSVGEVNDFLESLFVHVTPELKAAMWNMCGGVPLYLFSVLDLLHSEGAIKYLGGRRRVIESPSAFTELARTGRRADGVLEEQLKAISWEGTTLPGGFERAPLVLVGLLAIAHEPARVRKLCELASIDSEAYLSVRRTLMRHRIIRPSDEEWAFNFRHDLLRRAAVEVGRNNDPAQRLVERIIAKITNGHPTATDLELCADLASWMGFHEDAARALNAAYERVSKSENFTLIRRMLGKLSKALEPAALSSPKSYAEYLDCRSALAWATWNTGSLLEARAEYSRIVDDAMSGAGTVINPTVAEAYAADAQRRVLGLNLGLSDIPAFIESAERALELNGHPIVFNSIMNRLILYCAGFSHVDFGLELSKLTLEVFGDPEMESSGAVICSDIGALFRAAASHEALALYRRGVELAAGARQRIHNELDVLITEVMLGVRQHGHEELAAWRQRLIDNGLRSMLSRFDTFRAAVALLEGQVGLAQKLYRHVETSAAVYRYGAKRLDVWNDRMIAALMAGDLKEAYRLQAMIIAGLQGLVEQRSLGFGRIQALRPAIERQKRRFSHLAPLELELPAGRPAYSGVFVHIWLNLENLAGVRGGMEQSAADKLAGLWPSDIDHSAALTAFLNQPRSRVVQYGGVNLVLCAQ
ncbi:MAG: ATP-binding protein [Acidobacteriota bacterium]|nr:ATP-binding protein [Acidobacteriota bacterium]